MLQKHLQVFSHTTRKERLCIYRTARNLPQNSRVLEIGSHLGSSALLICLGIQSKGGRLYCVDTWNNETMPDGLKDTFEEFRLNTLQYSKIVTPIRKNSCSLAFADLNTCLDMAFIDGDHSEKAVRGDFEKVARYLKPHGLLLFHDVTHYPGVNKVVGEAMAASKWQLIRLVDSLAVLEKV
ncbi:class I SAM-dependent methyltransferase [Cyanobium sp. NIES-981]|uniref:class I SAM-dependent methyltransferase n=1 Tax=Cyanobium sp. NIES-981 TaxID=1851505 RepID=UPI001CED60E6